jgi:protein-S-isoprenylcysteine O-methyltransferase Ste14
MEAAMQQTLFFAYGVLSYAVFFVTFLYTVGFLTELVVPKTISDGPEAPVALAIFINTAILALFGVQHSVMARLEFKRVWTKIVPEPIERSTYVLISSLILLLLFWQWRPLPTPIWDVTGNSVSMWVLTGASLGGFLLALCSSFLIDHFDLFGLRQVYLHLRGREYTSVPFVMPTLYRWVRNPLMLGWLIAFWCTPHMTQGRLLFNIVATAYIFLGTHIEERDHARHLGVEYARYRETTSMIIPRAPKA